MKHKEALTSSVWIIGICEECSGQRVSDVAIQRCRVWDLSLSTDHNKTNESSSGVMRMGGIDHQCSSHIDVLSPPGPALPVKSRRGLTGPMSLR